VLAGLLRRLITEGAYDEMSSPYRPLTPGGPLRQQVYDTLEELIAQGKLPPGHRLVETELAQELGVSRGPIREALQMLARDGRVELRPRHGAYVHEPAIDDLDDYFQARTLLEVESARLAASRTYAGETSAEHLASLREVVERCSKQAQHMAANPDGIADEARVFHQEGSQRFHRIIGELTGNPVLVDLLEHLARRTNWYFTPGVLLRSPDAWRQHEQLLLAIEKGDGDRAAEVMRSHMAWTRDSYLRAFLTRTSDDTNLALRVNNRAAQQQLR
jgi:DNA-binding GntR family transcriptional regulator